jgi:hypothetical protein
MTPYPRYKTSKLGVKEARIKPEAAIIPPALTVLPGPILAMTLPLVNMPRPKKAMTRLKVIAVWCRIQPKSFSRGMMNIEKEYSMPMTRLTIRAKAIMKIRFSAGFFFELLVPFCSTLSSPYLFSLRDE